MMKTIGLCTVATIALAASANAAILSANFGLSGAQEVPANGSSELGIGAIDYDTTTNTFDMTLFVVGIPLSELRPTGPNATPVHIHLAPAGANGPIVIDLGFLASFQQDGLGISLTAMGVTAGGTYGGVISDPATVIQAFIDGNLYVNIHTESFPGGEIRGQIPRLPIPTPATATLMGIAGLVAAKRRR